MLFRLRSLQHFTPLAFLLAISSCQDMGVDPIVVDPIGGGPGIIVPGVGLEGIRLGYSVQQVEAVLGTPTDEGDVIGMYRGWHHFGFGSTKAPPMIMLDFCFIDNGDAYGPLDMILIGSTYRGKTKEGIGTGSSYKQVHAAYGAPDTTLSWPDQHTVVDIYCLNHKMFQIHYLDSVVSGGSIGYFVPMPEDPLYPGN